MFKSKRIKFKVRRLSAYVQAHRLTLAKARVSRWIRDSGSPFPTTAGRSVSERRRHPQPGSDTAAAANEGSPQASGPQGAPRDRRASPEAGEAARLQVGEPTAPPAAPGHQQTASGSP